MKNWGKNDHWWIPIRGEKEEIQNPPSHISYLSLIMVAEFIKSLNAKFQIMVFSGSGLDTDPLQWRMKRTQLYKSSISSGDRHLCKVSLPAINRYTYVEVQIQSKNSVGPIFGTWHFRTFGEHCLLSMYLNDEAQAEMTWQAQLLGVFMNLKLTAELPYSTLNWSSVNCASMSPCPTSKLS